MLAVGFCILVVEATTGWIAESLSLLADAAHLITDLASDLLAWFVASWVVAKTSRNENVIRSIGGFLQAALLALLGWFILQEAQERLANPHNVNAAAMVIVGTIAAIGNFWRHKILHSGSTHAHNTVTHRGQVFHILTDIGYSVAVALGGAVMLVTDYNSVDAYVSIGIVGVAWILSAFTVVLAAQQWRRA